MARYGAGGLLMAKSKSEAALDALKAAVQAGASLGTKVERNAVTADVIPDAGMIVVRDGDPGQPEITMSPVNYHYDHRAEVDILVQGGTEAQRDTRADTLRQAVSAAIVADRTLGGAVDWAEPQPAPPQLFGPDGGDPLKAATLTVVLSYATQDPLG